LFAPRDEVRSGAAFTAPFCRRSTGREVACAALFLISNEFFHIPTKTPLADAGRMAGIVRG
jgi:hypothetical protein